MKPSVTDQQPNTFPVGKYAVYKHGIAVKGGFASNEEAAAWSQSQGDKRLSIRDSGTISIGPFKKGDRFADSATMDAVDAVRDPKVPSPSPAIDEIAAASPAELATNAVAPLGLPEGLAERVANRLTADAERDGNPVGEASPEIVRKVIVSDLDGYRRNDLRDVLRPFIERVQGDDFDVAKDGGKVWSEAHEAIKASDERHESGKKATTAEPVAENPTSNEVEKEATDEVVPHDGWQNHLIKARDYANRLGLPDAIKDEHWTDAEGLTKAIEKHLADAAETPKPAETAPAETDEADDLFEQAFGQKYGEPEKVETPEAKGTETTTTGPLEIPGGTEEVQRKGNDLIHTFTPTGAEPYTQKAAENMKLPRGMRCRSRRIIAAGNSNGDRSR